MNYWKECITEALEEAGINATDAQIDTVTEWVEGAHENHGLATGQECIPNPLEATVAKLRRNLVKSQGEIDRADLDFRKNVAMRRNCAIADVVLLGDGHAEIRR